MTLRTYWEIREHLRSFGLKDVDSNQNPNLGLTALGDDLSDQLLSNLEPLGDFFLQCFEKYERENFGVQHCLLQILKSKVNYCVIKETCMNSFTIQLFSPPLVVG